MIAWRVERWRPAGVRPVEVWDLPFRGGLLYERLGIPALESKRPQLHAELAEALEHLQLVMAPRDPLYVVGGLASRPGLQQAVRDREMDAVQFGREPAYYGEAPARAELARRGLGGGLLVDLGQTSLKLTALEDGDRVVLARPLDELPRYLNERAAPPAHVAVEQAARLAALVAAAMSAHVGSRPQLAPGVVFALPCALGTDGTPGPCTYAGWAGDSTWAPRLLARVNALLDEGHGWHGREVQVLLINDAELAAAAAAEELGRRAHRLLAVTLGFGPGAAWLDP